MCSDRSGGGHPGGDYRHHPFSPAGAKYGAWMPIAVLQPPIA